MSQLVFYWPTLPRSKKTISRLLLFKEKRLLNVGVKLSLTDVAEPVEPKSQCTVSSSFQYHGGRVADDAVMGYHV